jgi:enoyl-CoA hydratase/carnithine racemase
MRRNEVEMPPMDTITLARDEGLAGLATLTLNRPDKLNAISGTMHRELQQACRELGDDATVRVVIVTGAGRAFSAGADLGARAGGGGQSLVTPPASVPPLEERLRATMGNRTSAALEGLPQVTIGAVNGLAIGGAVVFLACLDIRLAGESAWFSIPEVDLDIPLTWNALPRRCANSGRPARRSL